MTTSTAASPQVQRYAKDWVNVRSRRMPGARIVLVLNRGQAVMVDSLKQQWWRVVVDGKGVGYVYRAYLDTIPPRRGQ
ncbi:MAG TPA: SH3 domain-containing protein [Gemmatimonadales bacterium]